MFARIRSTFRHLLRRDFSDGVSREFQFHIDSRARELRARGIPSGEAARLARVEFSGVQNSSQQCRDARGFAHTLENLLQDIRFGARVLRKSPAFSVIVILTLALGIGMNTAIFSAAQAVFQHSAPFPESNRLVYVSRIFPGSAVAGRNFSYPGGRDIAQQNSSFDEFAIFQNFGALALTDGDEPVRVQANYVEPAYFELLGATAASGRLLRRDEDRFGSPARVVVISDGFWRRAFASSPGIVGRTIHLNQRSLTVIGVMSQNFHDAVGELDAQPPPDVWVPLGLSIELSGMFTASDRGPAVLWGLGRVKPGITLKQANADLAAIAAGASRQFPATDRGFGLLAIPLRDELAGKYYGPVWLLAACSAFILLIGCANVANLLIARAIARQKEFSVRAALGAGSGRLAAQLLIENLILSSGSAALGLLIASWAVTSLNAWARGNLPSVIQFSIDRSALAVFATISLFTALLFGGGSALLGSRANLGGVLRQASRGTTGAPRNVYVRLLVCAEVAMSVALLVGSGLLVKSLRRLTTVDLAFDTRHLLTLRLDLRSSLYADPKSRARFADRLLESTRAIPGAESAFIWGPAMIGRSTWVMDAVPEGRDAANPQNDLEFSRHSTNPGGLSALGVPILRGRDFDAGDTLDRPFVAVVSESLARQLWPLEDALGKRFHTTRYANWLTVIGVARDAKQRERFNLTDASMGLPPPGAGPQYDIYLPYAQRPNQSLVLAIRAQGADAGLTRSVREAVRKIDPALPVYDAAFLEERLAAEDTGTRSLAILTSGYAALALLLAALGLFGVLEGSVRGRTREIGIRMALGSTRSGVVTMILRQALALTLLGLGLGIAAALALAHLMTTFLFGVTPADASVYGAVAVILFCVALAASSIPARRAARVDPLIAMRAE